MDGDGVVVRVEQENVGGCIERGRTDGVEVLAAPGVSGEKIEPAAFKCGAYVAGDEVGLHGFGGVDNGSDENAGYRKPFAGIECGGGFEAAVGVFVDLQLGSVFGGHDAEFDAFENFIVAGVRSVFTDRADVLGAVLQGGLDLNGTCKNGSRVCAPGHPGQSDGFGDSNFVPAIKRDVAGHPWGVDEVPQFDDRGGGQ